MVFALLKTILFRVTLAAALLAATTVHAQIASAASPSPVYLDVSVPTENRVRDLISRMTLEEKTSQLVSVAPAIPRLQVPAYNYWTEGLHGIGMDGWPRSFPRPSDTRRAGTPLLYTAWRRP